MPPKAGLWSLNSRCDKWQGGNSGVETALANPK
jgi:hypothetical protein